MNELSHHLIVVLAKVFNDPGQARFWSQDGYGIDHTLLGVISGMLPPEACDLPRKYEGQRRRIMASIRELDANHLVAAAPGRSLVDCIRPTEDGLAYAAYFTRPWWQKLWERLTNNR